VSGRETWHRVAVPATALVLGAVVAGGAVWVAARPAPARVVRTEITTSGTTALVLQSGARDLAITRDGSRIVYRGRNQLLVRALDQLQPVPLTGLGTPRGVFVSPDGEWVGFVDTGTVTIKKVAISGGPPVTLTGMDGADRGATWGEDNTIIFATGAPNTGLQRVSASGGKPMVLTRPNREAGEGDHLWPEFLPGGQAVLFTITAATGGLEGAQIALLDLRTNEHRVLVRGGNHAYYVPTGHLVYGASGTLRAVAFDPARLAVTGAPVPIVEQVRTTNTGAVEAVVASNGTLAYVTGAAAAGSYTLVWMDQQGNAAPLGAPLRNYGAYPRLSPNGQQVAIDVNGDVWLLDVIRKTLTRLTFQGGAQPIWTPDGRYITYRKTTEQEQSLYWKRADGTGSEERLTTGLRDGTSSWSPDGQLLGFYDTLNAAGSTDRNIWLLPLAGDRKPRPFLQTPFNEAALMFSPDGRWVAYVSDESGRNEVYVLPFPGPGGKWQISVNGGGDPVWARSGRELFYLEGTQMMAVDIETQPTFRAGTPRRLFDGGFVTGVGRVPVYDVAPDGRFLMVQETSGEGEEGPASIVVVENWTEELKRLVPAR
jgi:serine/threonine-protein kinase